MKKLFRLFAKRKRSIREETIRKWLTPGSFVRVVPGKSSLNEVTLGLVPKDKAKRKK